MKPALKRFRHNEHGSIAIIFVIMILPIMMLVGVAVEYTRISSAETVLESTLDNSASNMVNLFRLGPQAEQEIADMIHANTGRDTATVKMRVYQSKLIVEARDEIETPLLGLMGQPKRELHASLEMDANVAANAAATSQLTSQQKAKLRKLEKHLEKSMSRLVKSNRGLSHNQRLKLQRKMQKHLRMVRNRINSR
ncbi:MAG: pilus assembly protein TadG-related protein [Pseudomonadota bacterium]